VLLLVSQLARDAGRRLQPVLWDAWGDSPTSQRLRYRDAEHADRIRRVHERLESALGLRMPNASDEAQDPEGADVTYEDAVAMLRHRTRAREDFRSCSKRT